MGLLGEPATYREAIGLVQYIAQLLAQFEENYEPAKVDCGPTLSVDEEFQYRWESKQDKEARKQRNDERKALRRRKRENRPNYWIENFLDLQSRYCLSTFPAYERNFQELDAGITIGLRRTKSYVRRVVVCDELKTYDHVIKSHMMIPDQKSKKKSFGHNSVLERYNETTRALGLKKWKTLRTYGRAFELNELSRFYYNYFKKHEFLGGLTPALVATKVRVKDWIELIKLAEIVTPIRYERSDGKLRKQRFKAPDRSRAPMNVAQELSDALIRRRRSKKYSRLRGNFPRLASDSSPKSNSIR